MKLPREELCQVLFLQSFVAQSHDVFASLLAPGERFIGVYLNESDDFFLLTDIGLHYIKGEIARFVPFTSLAAIELNVSPELLLRLKDGSKVTIQVRNFTEECADILVVKSFLESVLKFLEVPQQSEIGKISNAEDLKRFLVTYRGLPSDLVLRSLAGALASEELPEILAKAGIARSFSSEPQLWQALAVLLTCRSGESLKTELSGLEASLPISKNQTISADDGKLAEPSIETLSLLDEGCLRVLADAIEAVKQAGLGVLTAEYLLFSLARAYPDSVRESFGESFDIQKLKRSLPKENETKSYAGGKTIFYSRTTVAVLEQARSLSLTEGDGRISATDLAFAAQIILEKAYR